MTGKLELYNSSDFVYYQSRRKLSLVLVGCIVFFITTVFIIKDSSASILTRFVGGYLGATISFAGLLLVIFRLISPRPILIVNAAGIITNPSGIRSRSFAWSEIEKVYIKDSRPRCLAIRYVSRTVNIGNKIFKFKLVKDSLQNILSPSNTIFLAETVFSHPLEKILDEINCRRNCCKTTCLQSPKLNHSPTPLLFKSQRKGFGILLIVLGCLLIAGTILVFFVNMYTGDDAKFIAKMLIFLGMSIVVVGRKYSASFADQILAKDLRKPIIYLRSFDDDEIVPKQFIVNLGFGETDEEALSHIFNQIGPFIAIGRPGENLPILGAYRKYTSDEEWQNVVAELLNQAQFIVFKLNDSHGLRWEFTYAIKQLEPCRIIIYFPLAVGKNKMEAQCERFYKIISSLAPEIRFPSSINKGDFWTLDQNLNLIELKSHITFWAVIRGWARGSSEMPYMLSALESVFKNNGLSIPKVPLSFMEYVMIPLIIILTPIFVFGLLFGVIMIFLRFIGIHF